MGCAIIFAAMCEQLEYFKEHMNQFVVIAPGLSVYHTKAWVGRLAK